MSLGTVYVMLFFILPNLGDGSEGFRCLASRYEIKLTLHLSSHHGSGEGGDGLGGMGLGTADSLTPPFSRCQFETSVVHSSQPTSLRLTYLGFEFFDLF